jgi:cysteine synthase A
MAIYRSFDALIGHTPMLELANFKRKHGIDSNIFAKLELFNPAGSTKDRAAKSIIDEAEKSGKLTTGGTVIEATSGNTGIGLAAICASRGYKVIIVMPDNMSRERQLLMSAYGAEIVLTDGKLGMNGAIKRAEELAQSIDGAYLSRQFENPANPQAHKDTTGPEIWEDTEGDVDIFVCCVGTGGTISGTGEYLKSRKPDLRVVAVEPSASPYLSQGVSGAHKIQGIGAGFIPQTLNVDVYDEIVTVTDEEAYSYAKELARCEGILVGISSGAALCAAAKIAKRPENVGKNIVVLLPDTGERYLSSGVFG